MDFFVGTSGYSYKEWKGVFYPEKLAAKEYLKFYATRLSSVEINNTFYRMPKRQVVRQWREAVGEDFRFSIKASQRITHRKRLKDPEELLGYLFGSLEELGPALGVVLFQLPPNLRRDDRRLDTFLRALPDQPVAFEFRHPSWTDESVFKRLRDHGAAWVNVDERDDAPLIATADSLYLRLRREDYDDDALTAFANIIRSSEAERAFIFFKHEEAGAGPRLAKAFEDRLASRM